MRRPVDLFSFSSISRFCPNCWLLLLLLLKLLLLLLYNYKSNVITLLIIFACQEPKVPFRASLSQPRSIIWALSVNMLGPGFYVRARRKCLKELVSHSVKKVRIIKQKLPIEYIWFKSKKPINNLELLSLFSKLQLFMSFQKG